MAAEFGPETVDRGSQLLAMNWPQTRSDTNATGAAKLVDTSDDRVAATFKSPSVAPINPGAAVDPASGYLLAGPLGLAPSPPGGGDQVFQLSNVHVGLESAGSEAVNRKPVRVVLSMRLCPPMASNSWPEPRRSTHETRAVR